MNNAITAALGKEPADLLIRNARIVNVFTSEIHSGDVAVAGDRFLGFGSYEAWQTVDADGMYLCPAFIEGHIHIESTLLSPVEFARVVAGRGTGTVVCDPHEIANVLGQEGIRYFLDCSRGLPVDISIMLPSCVPATHLETSGAELTGDDLTELLLSEPDRILGLGEMMNVPGVLGGDAEVWKKLRLFQHRVIDGHCPGVSGKALNAYILSGPSSDHESAELAEAREKLRKGMHLMIRQGSSEKNLIDLLPLIHAGSASNISLVTDDRHADDLLHQGHLDYTVRLAISSGLDPLLAIRTVTLSTARYFGLKDRGAIAPGYRADFLLLKDLESVAIHEVYLAGRRLDDTDFPASRTPPIQTSLHLPELTEELLRLEDPRDRPDRFVKAIEIVPGQIITRAVAVQPPAEDGVLQADPQQDLAKLAVVERHRSSGRVGLGLVRGLGLASGALASSVAHDSHNCIVAGTNDRDMLLALRTLKEHGGGLAVVSDQLVLASVALPLAGLMSFEPIEGVVAGLHRLRQAATDLGCPEKLNVFMVLSFLALPVIPELRLTDLGLVDVERFQVTGLLWTE